MLQIVELQHVHPHQRRCLRWPATPAVPVSVALLHGAPCWRQCQNSLCDPAWWRLFCPQVHREQRHPGAVQVHLPRTQVPDSPVSVSWFQSSAVCSVSFSSSYREKLFSQPERRRTQLLIRRKTVTETHQVMDLLLFFFSPCRLPRSGPCLTTTCRSCPGTSSNSWTSSLTCRWQVVEGSSGVRTCRTFVFFVFLAGTSEEIPSAATVRSSGWWTGWRSPTPRSQPSTAPVPLSSRDAGFTTWRPETLTASLQVLILVLFLAITLVVVMVLAVILVLDLVLGLDLVIVLDLNVF